MLMMQMDTVGDAYIVATLLPPSNTLPDDEDAAENSGGTNTEQRLQLRTACIGALEVARAMIEAVEVYRQTTGSELRCRIGLSVGPVVAGVVGRLQVRPFSAAVLFHRSFPRILFIFQLKQIFYT
jgi:class 3 adenylate cyclase